MPFSDHRERLPFVAIRCHSLPFVAILCHFALTLYLPPKKTPIPPPSSMPDFLEDNKFLLYIYKQDEKQKYDFNYGDRLELIGKMTIPKKMNNPYEFDYKKY